MAIGTRVSNWSTARVADGPSAPRTLRRSKRSWAEDLLGRCVRGGAGCAVCLCHRSARGCLPAYSQSGPLLGPLGAHGRGQHSPSLRTLRPWRMGSFTAASVLLQRYGSSVPAGVRPRQAHGWRERRRGLGCGRGQAQACVNPRAPWSKQAGEGTSPTRERRRGLGCGRGRHKRALAPVRRGAGKRVRGLSR